MLDELKCIFTLKADDDIEFTDGDKHIYILKFQQTTNLVVNPESYYSGQIANTIETLRLIL